MPLYAIDPLPPRLRCEWCGATVAPQSPDGEAPEGELTAGQAGHV